MASPIGPYELGAARDRGTGRPVLLGRVGRATQYGTSGTSTDPERPSDLGRFPHGGARSRAPVPRFAMTPIMHGSDVILHQPAVVARSAVDRREQ